MAEHEGQSPESTEGDEAQHEETHEASHDAHDDHGGIGKYVTVTVFLMILTVISFAIGSTEWIMQTPSVGWTGMIAVSCAKASLVILFFMHLKWEANWKYVLTIPASIMSIFLMLMLVPDIGRRTRNYSESRWLHAADPISASEQAVESAEDSQPEGESSNGSDE